MPSIGRLQLQYKAEVLVSALSDHTANFKHVRAEETAAQHRFEVTEVREIMRLRRHRSGREAG